MLRSTIKFAKGAAVGAAAAYVLDPDHGRARQARLHDQALAATRRTARWAGRKTRYSVGRMKGRVMRSVGFGTPDTADDRQLGEQLRGTLRRQPVATDHLTTEVTDGVVRVRGEVASSADAQVIRNALASQAGVERVEDLMHLPGELPPNKAAALAASLGGAGSR
jgi:osmotically-inducible protein OsmY